ncbi:MAG: O-antigen ligase family protein, partial [Deltaproteobacteria bacterium]|nr:O-antigen ligase family protein [Deltaproteobacteria bacterium]
DGTLGLVRTTALVAFLYGTQVIIDSRRAVVAVFLSMGVAVVGACALAVAQILSEEFYLPASFVIAVGANAPRATGTFHNPNTFGTFLMCGVVLFSGLLTNAPLRRWQQALLLVPLVAAAAALVTTFSRANWLASMAGVFVSLALARRLRYLAYVAIGAALAIVVAKEFVPFADHIYERFVSIFTLVSDFQQVGRESGSARIYFIIAGLEMWLDHPVLGAGWRAFPVLFDQYKPIDFPHWVPTKESHTLFASILAEVGLVGFLAAVWIVWRVLGRGLAAVRDLPDPFMRGALAALLSLFIAFQVSLSFTADFSNNFLWFFTGMIFAVIRLGRSATGPAPVARPGT